VKSVGGREKGKKAVLNHGVVKNLVLTRLTSTGISILELTTHSTVSRSDGNTASKNRARLKDDGGSDKGQSSIDESWVGRADVLGCLRVNAGEAVQHVGVGDLDVVEEEETVVHGVVTELGTDVAHMDVLEGLVGLHVANRHDEGVRTVGLAIDDELGDDNSVVGCLAERTDPPL